jgi:hypothetical protein
MILMLLLPVGVYAGDQTPKINVNETPIVESVTYLVEGGLEISKALYDEGQTMVGEKYTTELTNTFADKIRKELKGKRITIDVNVNPGDKPGHVKINFQVRKTYEANVNERYTVESVTFTGIDDRRISQALRDEAQKMVGEKYNEETARNLAMKLQEELPDYTFRVKVKRGDKPDHVKVLFQTEWSRWKRFQIPISSILYHSKQGISAALDIPLETHHNVFAFGLVSDSDELLERNAGLRFRYEHRKVGTNLLHLRIDFDSYHQAFSAPVKAALTERPDVPDVYRARQNFAPSLTVYPTRDLMLSAGVSFQRLRFDRPTLHTETAYAGTADAQYRRNWKFPSGVEHDFSGRYDLRTATRLLDSDFVYTRHIVSADYTFSKQHSLIGVHFFGGIASGRPPLFERFSFGNTTTLRGWNKFDVAPLGGSRAAHGSLEYRYKHFQAFYDVGTVWDSGRLSKAKHGFGFGLVTKSGFFASLAFPIRLNNVAPVFMIGFREVAR